MDRRRFVTSMAATGLAGPAGILRAQSTGGALPRIGVLSFGSVPSGVQPEYLRGGRLDPDPSAGFRDGLRQLGYFAGRNVSLEYRYADGRPDRLARQVADLVQMKVDLILAGGPVALQAARMATSTIPIVVIGGSDPVREGWAQTLARPGGNVTGFTVTFPELGPKQLEILGQAVPGMTRVAVVLAPAELEKDLLNLEESARALGLQLQVLEIGGPQDLETAFVRARQGRAQGLYAVGTNTMVSNRSRLAELSISHRLPAICELTLLAEAGLLMSYGADLDALHRRAATYVDRILRGASAGDLPVERPSVLELVINRRTARALGITLPQSVLLRADRLIE